MSGVSANFRYASFAAFGQAILTQPHNIHVVFSRWETADIEVTRMAYS
jgi:hypothetical protein